MKSKPEKEKNVSQGISAPPDWWEEVETEAEKMGLGRSGFIRMAVLDYLKDGGKRIETEPMVTAV